MKAAVTPPRSGNQPGISSTLKIYGGKKVTPTIRVRLKASTDRREMVIPFADYDPVKHARVN